VTFLTNEAVVLSPTVARFIRRGAVWIVIALVAVLMAIIVLVTVRASTNADPLSPANAGPHGAKALVEVLKDHGVTVVQAGSLGEVRAAMTDPASTTVFFYDYGYYLTPEQLAELDRLTGNIVLANPSPEQLTQFAPKVRSGSGTIEQQSDAGCDYPAATRAGSISASGTATGFAMIGSAEGITCFRASGYYSLIVVPHGDETVTVLGATNALSNGVISEDGNAALAVNLLGSTKRLIWYSPTLADLGDSGLTLADVDPQWVEPVAALLIIVAIAAILWRSRRLGPLVVENLPVVVRASETMHGRARLYEKAASRQHALDALRIGAVSRLAQLVGLSSSATVDEVIGLVSSLTKRQPGEIRSLMLDAVPETDKELVELSDNLIELEQAVTTAVRP
jgi:hypothetical protein